MSLLREMLFEESKQDTELEASYKKDANRIAAIKAYRRAVKAAHEAEHHWSLHRNDKEATKAKTLANDRLSKVIEKCKDLGTIDEFTLKREKDQVYKELGIS